MGRGKTISIPVVAVMALFGCDMQDRLLYYPAFELPKTEELAALGIGFWPAGPGGYRGFIGNAAVAPGKGTVVVFHGNAGTAAERTYYTASLATLGYRVILAEYPHYGGRGGALGEASFVADARATVRLTAETFGGPVFLLGESLGCAVVAGVARGAALPIAGLLLITPWDTLASVAKTHFPWLPVSLFLRDRYDSIENLRHYRGRIAIVAAQRDATVPAGHAQALYRALPGDKRLWTIAGADHNDWPAFVDGSHWREWMAYLDPGNSY